MNEPIIGIESAYSAAINKQGQNMTISANLVIKMCEVIYGFESGKAIIFEELNKLGNDKSEFVFERGFQRNQNNEGDLVDNS